MHFNTKALHSGYSSQDHQKCLSPPIYQTTSYEFESIEAGRQLNSGEKQGHIYSRVSNPTVDILEKKVASLEGGLAAVACASGHAAQFLVLNNLLSSGDHMISSPYLYGGTYHQFHEQLPRLKSEVTFCDPSDFNLMRNSVRKYSTYAESMGNPELNPIDIKILSEIAHENDIPLVIDNTLGCCGYLIKPLMNGADIVLASLTKWAGGHGNSVGGIIVDSGRFDWSSGNFPHFTEKNDHTKRSIWDDWGYGAEKCQQANIPFCLNPAFINRIKTETLRIGGHVFHHLMHIKFSRDRNIGTRTERSCTNALEIAKTLEKNELVKSIRYPGLEHDKYHAEAQKYLKNGYGSIITFEPRGGYEAAEKIIENVNIFKHAANIGDSKSLILHPASTTHYQLTEREKHEAGVTESMIRLSIGIEYVNDLIEDLTDAIQST